MKELKDEGGGRMTIDGMDVLEGSKGLDHDNHVKDGKKGKFNKKSGKVEYEGDDDEKDDSSDGGFKSLGRKDTFGGEVPGPSKKESIRYPSLYDLDAKAMGLAKKTVGDDVTIVVRGKIKSSRADDRGHTVELELHDGKLGE